MKVLYEFWYDHKIPPLYETNTLPMLIKLNHIISLCGYAGAIKLNVRAVNLGYRERSNSSNLIT